MKRAMLTVSLLAALLIGTAAARAHCQIPCGIYDDQVRLDLLREHVTTIEKSMTQIKALSVATPVDYNQLVRWTVNKEQHADKLMEIVTAYFMTQRIKPAPKGDAAAEAKYTTQLTLLHQMLVGAMKSKQTTDVAHCEALRGLIDQFEQVYLGADAAHQHH